MIAKSPRMRISTSCSRMFLTDEPRAICARKALRSMKLPSELVLKKSGARLASNQATSASSTDRTKFRLSCCSLARCCSLSAMARLHWVGANAPPVRPDDLAKAIGENPDSGSLAPLRQSNWASSQFCLPSMHTFVQQHQPVQESAWVQLPISGSAAFGATLPQGRY